MKNLRRGRVGAMARHPRVAANDPLRASCETALYEREEQQRRRTLSQSSLETKHSRVIDFTHNDYLGLQSHQDFRQGLMRELTRANLPPGSRASRLLGGNHAVLQECEEDFSLFKGSASSLLFPSGYAANMSLCSLYRLKGAQVFSDRLNHASLIDGMRLAQTLGSPKPVVFEHNDLAQLAAKLKSCPSPIKIVVTESVFSMDGDLPDLAHFSRICRENEAYLILDEAHALGIKGQQGEGRWKEIDESWRQSHVVTVNPCGKAMGVAGAFVSGPLWLRDYLINFAREFIYSTGTSPWIALALRHSIATIPHLNEQRQHLNCLQSHLKGALRERGWTFSPEHNSPIIPLIFGSDSDALKMSQKLFERGIRCAAIRPPTVPLGTSRLRLSLSSEHQFRDLEYFIDCLEK